MRYLRLFSVLLLLSFAITGCHRRRVRALPPPQAQASDRQHPAAGTPPDISKCRVAETETDCSCCSAGSPSAAAEEKR